MLSAMASVMIIVGAEAEGGVNLMPIQPAAPIAAIIDNMITAKEAKVPLMLRVVMKIVMIMTKNISGIKVPISCCDASKKAPFSIITPER